MKILRDVKRKDGKRTVTVTLDSGETLLSIYDTHYRLGYPHEDIVSANIISEANPVQWCCIEQRWID